MREYPLDQFMIVDDLDPYPSSLWDWGVQNRNGFLHQKPIEFVRYCLLPREEASVTRDGIYFKRLHYTCKLAIQQSWFVKARSKRSWKITVAYDPRLVNHIYIPLDNGEFEVCDLLEDDKVFLGCSFKEVEKFYQNKTIKKQSRRTNKLRSRVEKEDKVEEILNREEEKVKNANNKQSKNSQLKNINANRAEERKHDNREKAQTWLPQNQPAAEPVVPTSVITQSDEVEEPVVPTSVITQPNDDDSEYVPPHRPTDKLRSRQRQPKNPVV